MTGTGPAENPSERSEPSPPKPSDPTAIRSQPALTTSSGTMWLVVGGIFVAISLAMLLAMSTLPNGGVAVVAAITIAVIYLGMIAARAAVPPGRRRLRVLAVALLVIAAVALGAVMIVAASAWDSVPR